VYRILLLPSQPSPILAETIPLIVQSPFSLKAKAPPESPENDIYNRKSEFQYTILDSNNLLPLQAPRAEKIERN
jgi:hypothetical protein